MKVANSMDLRFAMTLIFTAIYGTTQWQRVLETITTVEMIVSMDITLATLLQLIVGCWSWPYLTAARLHGGRHVLSTNTMIPNSNDILAPN